MALPNPPGSIGSVADETRSTEAAFPRQGAIGVVGGSAIVAMGGALTVAATETHGGTIVSDPGTFTAPSTTEMTTGETTKSSTGQPTVSPSVASPPVTATPPEAP